LGRSTRSQTRAVAALFGRSTSNGGKDSRFEVDVTSTEQVFDGNVPVTRRTRSQAQSIAHDTNSPCTSSKSRGNTAPRDRGSFGRAPSRTVDTSATPIGGGFPVPEQNVDTDGVTTGPSLHSDVPVEEDVGSEVEGTLVSSE
jgi:hypothetical protein